MLEGAPRRALAEHDPLRGIAALVARCAAAFVPTPHRVKPHRGVWQRTDECKLEEAVPSGRTRSVTSVSAFLRPMVSPGFVEPHHDAFVVDDYSAGTVDLAAHRGDY